MSVRANVWLKVDMALSQHFTPLIDTHELIRRVNAWHESHKYSSKTLACTMFDFTSLHTNISCEHPSEGL